MTLKSANCGSHFLNVRRQIHQHVHQEVHQNVHQVIILDNETEVTAILESHRTMSRELRTGPHQPPSRPGCSR